MRRRSWWQRDGKGLWRISKMVSTRRCATLVVPMGRVQGLGPVPCCRWWSILRRSSAASVLKLKGELTALHGNAWRVIAGTAGIPFGHLSQEIWKSWKKETTKPEEKITKKMRECTWWDKMVAARRSLSPHWVTEACLRFGVPHGNSDALCKVDLDCQNIELYWGDLGLVLRSNEDDVHEASRWGFDHCVERRYLQCYLANEGPWKKVPGSNPRNV